MQILPSPGATEEKENTSGVSPNLPVKASVKESASVDEVVSKVLSSAELKTLIAEVAAEKSTKGHLTADDISDLVK